MPSPIENLAKKIKTYYHEVDVAMMLDALKAINDTRSISIEDSRNLLMKIKRSSALREDISAAKTQEHVAKVMFPAIFDRFAYTPDSVKARVQQASDKDLNDRKVTLECHDIVGRGRLTPNEFSSGKGIANIHKDRGFDEQRKSCT